MWVSAGDLSVVCLQWVAQSLYKCEVVAQDCLWFWQLKDPFGQIEKSMALYPGPWFLPQPDISINVCKKAVKPYLINPWQCVFSEIAITR